MTPVVHTLTGIAIGCVAVPRGWSVRTKAIAFAALAVAANLPDAPLPGWGHDRYHVSHSLLVTAAGALTLAVVARVGGAPIAVATALGVAWLSHLLLDSFYNHGKGIMVGWPLGEWRLNLSLPWFATMQVSPLVSWHNARVFAVEAAYYGALLLAAIGFRRWAHSADRRTSTENSGGQL